jgi:hypothetical protein
VELSRRTLWIFVAHARPFATVFAPLIVRRKTAATALPAGRFAP